MKAEGRRHAVKGLHLVVKNICSGRFGYEHVVRLIFLEYVEFDGPLSVASYP